MWGILSIHQLRSSGNRVIASRELELCVDLGGGGAGATDPFWTAPFALMSTISPTLISQLDRLQGRGVSACNIPVLLEIHRHRDHTLLAEVPREGISGARSNTAGVTPTASPPLASRRGPEFPRTSGDREESAKRTLLRVYRFGGVSGGSVGLSFVVVGGRMSLGCSRCRIWWGVCGSRTS